MPTILKNKKLDEFDLKDFLNWFLILLEHCYEAENCNMLGTLFSHALLKKGGAVTKIWDAIDLAENYNFFKNKVFKKNFEGNFLLGTSGEMKTKNNFKSSRFYIRFWVFSRKLLFLFKMFSTEYGPKELLLPMNLTIWILDFVLLDYSSWPSAWL